MEDSQERQEANGLALPPRLLALLTKFGNRSERGILCFGFDSLEQLTFAIDAGHRSGSKRRKVQEALDVVGPNFREGHCKVYRADVIPCLLGQLGLLEMDHAEWLRISAWLENHIVSTNLFAHVQGISSDRQSSEPNTFSEENSLPRSRSAASLFEEAADSSNCSASGNSSSRTDLQMLQMCHQEKHRVRLLESCLRRKNAKIQKKEKDLRLERQKNQRLQKKLDAANLTIEQAQNQSNLALRVTRTSDAKLIAKGEIFIEGETDAKGWLTPQGLLSLALRRNVANVASTEMGLSIMVDVSRWTVTRAELKTAACLVASSRLFWRYWYEQIWSSSQSSPDSPEDTFSCTIVHYSQDATNRAIFNRQKLQSVIVEGHYVVVSQTKAKAQNNAAGTKTNSFAHVNWQSIKRLSDVLPVVDGTGKATAEMSHKLLSGLGCPTWRSFSQGEIAHEEDDCHATPAAPAFTNLQIPLLVLASLKNKKTLIMGDGEMG